MFIPLDLLPDPQADLNDIYSFVVANSVGAETTLEAWGTTAVSVVFQGGFTMAVRVRDLRPGNRVFLPALPDGKAVFRVVSLRPKTTVWERLDSL